MISHVQLAGCRKAALLVTAVLLTACATMNDRPAAPPLEGTHWRLANLQRQALPAGPAPTLQFDGPRVSGSDGCNRYTGPYTRAGANLRIGPGLASTRMACPGDLERRAADFARVLGETHRYRVQSTGTGDHLDLLDASGAVIARFTAESQALAGTRWEVTGINNGRQAVVSVQSGTRVTLAFDDQGRVSGSAGCNRFTARFETSPGNVRIVAPAATRMACPGPGVMAQEQAFLSALEASRTARIEGDQLELRDADGALQVSARADAQRR
jgi:heat shock protein HslJ